MYLLKYIMLTLSFMKPTNKFINDPSNQNQRREGNAKNNHQDPHLLLPTLASSVNQKQ